jgi:hypothetical protein
VLVVPYLAGAFGGLLTTRAAPLLALETAPLWGFASGLLTGCVLGAVAAFAGGPLGDGRLAAVGPSGWQVGVVASLEVGLAAAVTAGVANWLRLRSAAGNRAARGRAAGNRATGGQAASGQATAGQAGTGQAAAGQDATAPLRQSAPLRQPEPGARRHRPGPGAPATDGHTIYVDPWAGTGAADEAEAAARAAATRRPSSLP